MDTFLIFDTETNGLEPTDAVFSFAALVIDPATMEPIEEIERYYFAPPGETLNLEAIEVNGLTPEVIEERRAGADYPAYFADDAEIVEIMRGRVLYIAHNFDFDAAFIRVQHNFDPTPGFCTMRASQYLYPATKFKHGEPKWPRLIEAYEWATGSTAGNWHDALFDCRATLEIFRHLQGIGEAPR